MTNISHTYLLLLATMVTAGVVSTAEAQTAEETAAFILEGNEDGSKYHYNDGDGVLISGVVRHEEGTNTFRIIEKENGKPDWEVDEIYTKTKDCIFAIDVKDLDGNPISSTLTIDMSRYSHFGFNSDRIVHYFSGKCAVKREDQCSDTFEETAVRDEHDRLDKAITYLREKICTRGF